MLLKNMFSKRFRTPSYMLDTAWSRIAIARILHLIVEMDWERFVFIKVYGQRRI